MRICEFLSVVLIQDCSNHQLGCNWQMHYLLMEAIKIGSMQRSCHVLPGHLICWTMFNVNMSFGLLINNVEVSDVEMSRVLGCTPMSIGLCLEQHSRLVVLVWDVLLNWVSLHLKE